MQKNALNKCAASHTGREQGTRGLIENLAKFLQN